MTWRKIGYRFIDLLTQFQENWRNLRGTVNGRSAESASHATSLPALPVCHHQDFGKPTALQVMPVSAVASSQGIGGTDGAGGTNGTDGSVGNDSSPMRGAVFSISALKQWLVSCFKG